MRFATFNHVSLNDLVEMVHGNLENTITDLDFLETLADQHCFMVPPWIMQAGPSGELKNLAGMSIEQVEKEHIRSTLELTQGNREQAAKILGIGERTLYRKIKEYGIQ